jgi:predicted phage baseplate assembly protein
MPLELQAPQLNRLTYEEIKRQAIQRLPRYTPDWTDFNESDPGMTMVELFAWLAEMLIEQMNRVPERVHVKLLQNLNMELRPAQAAEAHLVFTSSISAQPADSQSTFFVPQFTRVGAQSAGGDELVFETSEGLSLIRLELTDVQVFDGAAFTVVTALNKQAGASFRPFGWQPQIGGALYLGFTQSDPPIQGRIFPQSMNWRVFLPLAETAGQPIQCEGPTQNLPPAPVRLEWEYRPNPSRWKRLEVFRDESLSFTREGYIQVHGPPDPVTTVEGRVTEERFWLRVRLAERSYPIGRAPVLDSLIPNIVAARNLSTVQEEILGESLGQPGQILVLERKPVEQGSVKLYLQDPDGNRENWTQKDDLLASNVEAPHYTLNLTSGEIKFGDGEHGRIPTAGNLVIAERYRYGGGAAGNVDVDAISSLLSPLTGVDAATNPRKAVGGADEENIKDFLLSAPSKLRHRDRAISVEDYNTLASEAGGVGKTIALPGTHPDFPGVRVPGAVTVVVAPDSDDLPPRPSQQQLEVVCRYLNERRLLTTELYVQGPEYIQIRVEARVACQPYAATDQVRNEIVQALNASLDPLGRRKPPEGVGSSFQRLGGEFGRDLYPTSLFSIIQSVPNVVAVQYLAVNGQEGARLGQPIPVPASALVYGAPDHNITVVPYEEPDARRNA